MRKRRESQDSNSTEGDGRWHLPRHSLFHPKHKPRNVPTFAPRPPKRPSRVELEASLYALRRSMQFEEERNKASSPWRNRSGLLRELETFAERPPATAPPGSRRSRTVSSSSRRPEGPVSTPETDRPSEQAPSRALCVAEMLGRPEDLAPAAMLIRSIPKLREVDLGGNPRWSRDMPFAVPCVFGAIAQNVDLEEVHGTIPKEHRREVTQWLNLFQSLREDAADRQREENRESKISTIIETLKEGEVQAKRRMYDHWRNVIRLLDQERRAAYRLVNEENDTFDALCEAAKTAEDEALDKQRAREERWNQLYSELVGEMDDAREKESQLEGIEFSKMFDEERITRNSQIRREREQRKFLQQQRQDLCAEEHAARKSILQEERDEKRLFERNFREARDRMRAAIDAVEAERKRKLRAEMEELHEKEVIAARHARQAEGILHREATERTGIERQLQRNHEVLVRANFDSFSSAKLRETQRVAAEIRQNVFSRADSKVPRIIFKWEPPALPEYPMNMYATPMILNDAPLFRILLEGIENELTVEQKAAKCCVEGGTIYVKISGPSVNRNNDGTEMITLVTTPPEKWDEDPFLCGEAAPKPFSFRETSLQLAQTCTFRGQGEETLWEEGELSMAEDDVTVLWNGEPVAVQQSTKAPGANAYLNLNQSYGFVSLHGSQPIGMDLESPACVTRSAFLLELYPGIPNAAIYAILAHLAYGNSAVTGYDLDRDTEQGYVLSCSISLKFRASCLPENNAVLDAVTRTSSCSVRLSRPLLATCSKPEEIFLEDSDPVGLFDDFIMNFPNGVAWYDMSEEGSGAAAASGASVQGAELCLSIGGRDPGDRIVLRNGCAVSVGEERSLSNGQVAREIMFAHRLVGLLAGDLFNTGDTLLPDVPCGPSTFLTSIPTLAFPSCESAISPTVLKISILRDVCCSLFMFQELLRGLMYTCVSKDPIEGLRVIDLKLTLRDGTCGSIRRLLRMVPVDDITQITLQPEGQVQRVYRAHVDHPAALERYVPAGAPFAVAPAAIAEDPDSTDFTGGYLEVEIVEGFQEGDCVYFAEDKIFGLIIEEPSPSFSPLRRKSLSVSRTESPQTSEQPLFPMITFNDSTIGVVSQGLGLRVPPPQQKPAPAPAEEGAPEQPLKSFPLLRLEFKACTIECLQQILRRVSFRATGTNTSIPLRYGKRKFEFRAVIGDPTEVKYRKFDPFVPIVDTTSIYVSEPLVNTYQHSYLYREGSGMLNLGHFSVLDDRSLGYHPWNNGFVTVEFIRGGTREDRLYLRSLDPVVSDNGFSMYETATPLPLPDEARMPPTFAPDASPPGSPRTSSIAPKGGSPEPGFSVKATRQGCSQQPMLSGSSRHFELFTADRSFLGSVSCSARELACVFRTTDKKPQIKRKGKGGKFVVQQPAASPPQGPTPAALIRRRSLAYSEKLTAIHSHEGVPVPVKRRDVVNMLRLLTYELRSSNPTKLRKIILLTISDGFPSSQTHLIFEINIQTVDDATEIHRTVMGASMYRHAFAGCFIPAAADCKLFDPDSDCFNGGFVSITLAAGAVDGDMLRLMTLAQQAERQADVPKLQKRLSRLRSSGSMSEVMRRRSTIMSRKMTLSGSSEDAMEQYLFYVDYAAQEIHVCRTRAITKEKLNDCIALEAACWAHVAPSMAPAQARREDRGAASRTPTPVPFDTGMDSSQVSFTPPEPFRKVATYEHVRHTGRLHNWERGGTMTIHFLDREPSETKELEADDSVGRERADSLFSNQRQSVSFGPMPTGFLEDMPSSDIPNVTIRMAEQMMKLILYTTAEKPLKVRSGPRVFQIRVAPSPSSEEGKVRFPLHVGPTLITTTDSIGAEDVVIVPSVHRRSAGPVTPFSRLLIVQTELLFKTGYLTVTITDNYRGDEDVVKIGDIGPARPFQLKRTAGKASLFTVKDAFCGAWETIEEDGGTRGFILRFDNLGHFTASMAQQLIRSITYENKVPSVTESFRSLKVELCDGGPFQLSTFSTVVIIEGDDDAFELAPPLPQTETIVLVLPLPSEEGKSGLVSPAPGEQTEEPPAVPIMPNAKVPERDHTKVLSAPAFLDVEAAPGDVLFLKKFVNEADGRSIEITADGEVIVDDAGYIGYLHGGAHHLKTSPQREEVQPTLQPSQSTSLLVPGQTPSRSPKGPMGPAGLTPATAIRKSPMNTVRPLDPSMPLAPHLVRLYFDDCPYSCIETVMRNVMFSRKDPTNITAGRRMVTVSVIGCRLSPLLRFAIGVEVTGPMFSIGTQYVTPRGELLPSALVRYAPKSMLFSWSPLEPQGPGTEDVTAASARPPAAPRGSGSTPVVLTKNSGVTKKGNDLFLGHDRFGTVLQHGIDGNGRFEVEFSKSASSTAAQRLLRGLAIAPSASFVPLSCTLTFNVNPWARAFETFTILAPTKKHMDRNFAGPKSHEESDSSRAGD